MKLCVDCKHTKDAILCNNPEIAKRSKIDPVWGDKVKTYDLTKLQRRGRWLSALLRRTCGKSGRWWEPKPKEDLIIHLQNRIRELELLGLSYKNELEKLKK